jgi:hypothetical protein
MADLSFLIKEYPIVQEYNKHNGEVLRELPTNQFILDYPQMVAYPQKDFVIDLMCGFCIQTPHTYFQLKRKNNYSEGLTPKEKETLQHLTNFWNSYLELPDANGLYVVEEVHALQGVIALRVAKRINPEFWT